MITMQTSARQLQLHPSFTLTVSRNSRFQPCGLNRTPVYVAALIKQCLIQKIMEGSYWVELT